jgi:hypothetical protein
LKTGEGHRATRQLSGAIQNLLQTDTPVNGVVLREKKVLLKTKGGLREPPVSEDL